MERTEALAWAQAQRARRDEVYALLASGEWGLAEVFAAAVTDPAVAAIKLLPVLEARPGVSKVATRRRLAAADIDEFVTIGEVPAAAIVEMFDTVDDGGRT